MITYFFQAPPPSGEELYNEFQAKWEDQHFKDTLEKRKELPVYNHKQHILDTIRDNQVIIIRGATGCGKTTQVGRIAVVSCPVNRRTS